MGNCKTTSLKKTKNTMNKYISTLFFLFLLIGFVNILKAQEAENNFENAKTLMQDGDYGKALKHLNKALSIKNEWAEAYLRRGQVYYELGKYKEMIKDCENALKYDKNLVQAYFNLGIAQYNLKNYAGALPHFTMFLAKKPKDAEALAWRGMANFYLKNKKQACEDWEKAIDLGNSYVKPYYNKNCQEENASQIKE